MPASGNTIVVTTDLSANSRAGIRYAIQLARLSGAELIFLHVHQVLRASSWSDAIYRQYIERFEAIRMEELMIIVKSVFRSCKAVPGSYRFAVHHNLDVVDGVLEFAKKNKASLICSSTHGRGVIMKVFGSTTSSLITHSDIPVLCVPSAYRFRPVSNILYASDMDNYEKELKQVVGFARPLDAAVDMVHIALDYETVPDKEKLEKKLLQKLKYHVSVHVIKRDTMLSLLDNLRKVIGKTRPSMVVFFTNRKHTFFEKFLTPNNAKEYSFDSKIPFLSINKS